MRIDDTGFIHLVENIACVIFLPACMFIILTLFILRSISHANRG